MIIRRGLPSVAPDASLPPPLELRGLSCRYGDRQALSEVSVTLAHQVTALIGVNGAGKTTLMRTAAGAMRPRAGQVRIAGLDPYAARQRRAALSRAALMPQ